MKPSKMRDLLKKKCCFLTIIVLTCIAFFIALQSSTMWKGVKNNRFKLHAKSDTRRMRYDNVGYELDHTHVLEENKSKYSNSNYFPIITNSATVKELGDVLANKIAIATIDETKMKPVCTNSAEVANSCDGRGCLRTKFPENTKDRVAELILTKQLQITPKIRRVLDKMAESVKGGVKFMILTAASSNHFMELQALLSNVHQNVFPQFKNFTMVIYNIGLTPEERDKLVEYSKCQVVDFPFHEFRAFVSKNKCYSWKPIIIKAHIKQANVIVWADTSIRFDQKPSYLTALLRKAKKRGVLLGNSQVISPFRTFRDMYHFFGDEPCMYLNMNQVQATVGLYAREFFVDRAILEPWVACAVTESCMCPVDKPKKSCEESRKMADAWEKGRGPIVYGLCHRFDQSAISLILHKLYQGYFNMATFHVNSYLQIKRKDQLGYFDSLGMGQG